MRSSLQQRDTVEQLKQPEDREAYQRPLDKISYGVHS